jgi:hypothetical protein
VLPAGCLYACWVLAAVVTATLAHAHCTHICMKHHMAPTGLSSCALRGHPRRWRLGGEALLWEQWSAGAVFPSRAGPEPRSTNKNKRSGRTYSPNMFGWRWAEQTFRSKLVGCSGHNLRSNCDPSKRSDDPNTFSRTRSSQGATWQR